MILPPKIKEWLNNRGITDTVIDANKIDWNGSQIVIPIFDRYGHFLFNKYRRDPYGPVDIPKYTYEKGSTAQLFNAHKLSPANHAFGGLSQSVIVVEGELDAMRLEAAGYLAVSSTGGAGTFKDEWVSMLSGKDVYICFDNDEAGTKGAIKLLIRLPGKLVVIPRSPDVKDITDYYKAGNSFPLLLEQAEAFPILSDPVPTFKFIKDIEAHKKKYKYFLEELLVKERNAKAALRPYRHLDTIRETLLIAIANLDREIRRMRYFKTGSTGNDEGTTRSDLLLAKEIPLETLYEGQLRNVGGHLVGACPFHNERTGSFTIYTNQNRFYCFGCSAGGDAIDFIMRRDQCKFLEAVKKLIGK